MRIQIVGDHAPPRLLAARREQSLEEIGEILLGARVADLCEHLSADHVESRDQGLRAVPFVFEFLPGDLARQHGQVRGDALLGLHAGHFVDRHRADILFGRRRRVLVDRADVGALAFELRVGLGREPSANQMRFEVSTFLKSARPSRARCFPRCRA